MSTALSPRPFYRATPSTFEGMTIFTAVLHGERDPSAVVVRSILDALGCDSHDGLRSFLRQRGFPAEVDFGARFEHTSLVTFEAFFYFCMIHPSPRLDSLREHLARIAGSVQRRGGYFDPDASASRYLSEDTENDPDCQILAQLLKQKEEQVRQRKEMGRIGTEVREIREQIGRGPSSWTVAAWLDKQGYRATVDIMKHEGSELRRICNSRGITVPDEKVCNGGSFPARMWPMEAIRVWWPQCCGRYGWAVTWK